MPLRSPCSDSAMGCADLAECSFSNLSDISISDPCRKGTLIVCKGDGTLGSYLPPSAMIAGLNIFQSVGPGANVVISNLATTFYDSGWNMPGANELTIKDDGFYSVTAHALVTFNAPGFARLDIRIDGDGGPDDTRIVGDNNATGFEYQTLQVTQTLSFSVGQKLTLRLQNDTAAEAVIKISSLSAHWIAPTIQ